MQSNKASKKTLKIAEETAAVAPETGTPADLTGKPRTPRSSKPKKDEINETTMSAKHHRKASSPITLDIASVDTSETAKTMAASAGVGSTSESAPSGEPTYEDIAVLAHSYWLERGGAPGSAEQDWLRAERELKAKQ